VATKRKAEELADQPAEELYQENLEAKDEAEEEAGAQLIKNLASKLPTPAATVTPEGRAVLPTKTTPPPNKRPPEKASLDEVRKKVTAQIRKALPAIAAAVKANGGQTG
jgi:hypothetical protein